MLKRLKSIAHPFIAFTILAFSLIFECDVWLFKPPQQWWFICVLMLAQALAIGCYWSPVCCSIALLLLNGIGEYALPGYSQYTSYFMFLAVVLISYRTSNRIGTLLWVVLATYTCLETVLRPGSFTGYGCFAFCMLYVLAVVIGRYMAWEQRRTERIRESIRIRSRLEQLEANQYLAVCLHDALSQELALISMETQLQSVDKTVPDEERWRRVSEYTQNALTDLRRIIVQLRGSDGEFRGTIDIDETMMSLLQREAAAGDKLLHEHGFSGETVLESAQDANVHSSELNGLLSLVCHEIYTNMLKHGDNSKPYHIDVIVSDTRLRINYHNAICDTATPLPGGSGLDSTRHVVDELGGSSEHESHDGVWYGNITIPLDGHV